jgi:acyl-CoA thioester hydrolase
MNDRQILIPCTVQFVDTDASGGVHNTAALRWAEIAEHQLLRQIGFQDIRRLPRVHIEVTYHQVLRDGDTFDLELAIEHVGRTSVSFSWFGRRDSVVAFNGQHTAVYVDDRGDPRALPDVLTSLEKP